MRDLPREEAGTPGPAGRSARDGAPADAARAPGRGRAAARDRREGLLLLAAATAAAAALIHLGWQADRLSSALSTTEGDVRSVLVANHAAGMAEDVAVLGAALAAVALRRAGRWAGAGWGALLAIGVLRTVATIPGVAVRFSVSASLDPPAWVEAVVLAGAALSALLLLPARPPSGPRPAA